MCLITIIKHSEKIIQTEKIADQAILDNCNT